MHETVMTNAVLALPDALCPGTVVLRGEAIAEVQPGRVRLPAAIDLDGDMLIPGIVDLHTDNLERQVQPRALPPLAVAVRDDRARRAMRCRWSDHGFRCAVRRRSRLR